MCRTLDGDNYSVMLQPQLKVLPGQKFKVGAIVGNKGDTLAHSVTQLFRIAAASESGIRSSGYGEAAGPNEGSNQRAYILVEVEVNKQMFHWSLSNGSISSTGTRLRSM